MNKGRCTFLQDSFLRFHVVLQISSSQPDLDALSNMLYGIRKDDLIVIILADITVSNFS